MTAWDDGYAAAYEACEREIDDLRARLAATEAERDKWLFEYNTLKETSITPLVRRAEELAAIVESQRVMLAAADRYRALLDLETWMARAERAEADADRLAAALSRWAENAIPPELHAHDAAVAERPQP